MDIRKYDSTPHIQGSRHQIGDSPEDLKLSSIIGKHATLEEKFDASNSAVSFDASGNLLLQSRGHYLNGGPREAQFALFKTWAQTHAWRLQPVLRDRFIMYGEWMYAKHTCFYDALPAYFLEFDVFDRQSGHYLSTEARRELLYGLPIVPVTILSSGIVPAKIDLLSLVKQSVYRTDRWREALIEAAEESGSRIEMVEKQTDDNNLSEGLYGKIEEAGAVTQRFKFVRSDFIQTITESHSHWHSRPIIRNRLRAGVDIFASETGVPGAYDDPNASV